MQLEVEILDSDVDRELVVNKGGKDFEARNLVD